MEPLLRGYKRSIIVPQHRTIPSDLGIEIIYTYKLKIKVNQFLITKYT